MAPSAKSAAAAGDEKPKKKAGPYLTTLELAFWLPFNVLFALVPFVWSFLWICGLQGPRATFVPVAAQLMSAARVITRVVGPVERESFASAMGWNLVVFSLFGCTHSFWASAFGKRLLRSAVPAQAVPTMFSFISNVAFVCAGAAWASCPGNLWDLSGTPLLAKAVLSCKVLTLVLLSVHLLQFDPLELFGTSALFRPPEGDAKDHSHTLVTTGFFRYVRHPLYTFMLLQTVLEPTYTLDRLTFSICALLYISWGHKLEDRKLERKFGPAYAKYCREVAAFIPFVF